MYRGDNSTLSASSARPRNCDRRHDTYDVSTSDGVAANRKVTRDKCVGDKFFMWNCTETLQGLRSP